MCAAAAAVTHAHMCETGDSKGRGGELAAAVENLTDAGESNMCVSPGSIDGPAKCHARGIPPHRGGVGEFAEADSTKPF